MNGFVNLFKSAGMTSHDAVVWFRKLSGERKTGHLGTLDPMATGVLPLALGSCRKLTEYLIEKDKEYDAEFTFGIVTDTGDITGQVLFRRESQDLTEGRVLEVLPVLTGEIVQIPPVFSAVKVAGRRLYELARRGQAPQPEPRKVTVYEFSLAKWKGGPWPRGTFHLRVGKGTYVRALAQSLGEMVGAGAVVSRLERTRAGPFRIQESYTPERLAALEAAGELETAVVPATRCLPEFPSCVVGAEEARLVRNGAPMESLAIPEDIKTVVQRPGHPGLFFLVDRKGNVLALMRFDGRRIRYEKVLVTAGTGCRKDVPERRQG